MERPVRTCIVCKKTILDKTCATIYDEEDKLVGHLHSGQCMESYIDDLVRNEKARRLKEIHEGRDANV